MLLQRYLCTASRSSRFHGPPSTRCTVPSHAQQRLVRRPAPAAGHARLHGTSTALRGGPSHEQRWVRPVSSLKLGGLALVAAAAGIVVQDEGVRRSALFWGRAFPIYLHYRYVQWLVSDATQDESDRAFNTLHDRYAPVAEAQTLKLRGFYLKNAQMMSTVDDFMPPQYLRWCKKMQNEVPTEFDPSEVRAVVERSLGRPLDEVFSEWEDEPCGVASIGAVHRAVLRSTGTRVAVKVQFPGIERRFRSDLKTIKRFCRLAMPQHVKPMEEIEKQFVTEFDFAGEAQNLSEIYANVMPVWGDRVVIPRPFSDLCTKEVLVMEYLEGPTLVKGIRESFRRYAEANGTTLEALEAEQRRKVVEGAAATTRTLEEEKTRLRRAAAMLRARGAVLNAGKFVLNWAVGWIPGVGVFEYSKTELPLNLAEVIDLLCRVHAHEIIMDGAFNGDPSVQCLSGTQGMYCSVLMGGSGSSIMASPVKHLDVPTRINYAKTLIALAREDKAEVLRLLHESGLRTKYNNPEVIYRQCAFWNDRNTEDVTQGMNVQEFMDWCEATDPMREINEGSILAGRVSVMMRGLGNAFGIQIRTAVLFRPIAEEFLRSQGIEY